MLNYDPLRKNIGEGEKVIELLAEQGLGKGERWFTVIMMCELPSNALLS